MGLGQIVEVIISGDATKAAEAMKQASASVHNGVGEIKGSLESINSMVSKVQGTFLAFSAVIAGGASFKAAINGAIGWTGENVKLAKALGITTEQASVLNLALGDVYVSSETMVAASAAMSRQVNTNAAAFEVLGVATRDANGHIRPATELMADVNTKLAAIKNPMEQNIAGMQVYGRGWSELKGVLKLNEEAMAAAQEKAERLHLIVGPEGVAQMKAYKANMNDIEDVAKSLQVQFGSALLPVFVKLGAWLGNEGPVVAEGFGKALSWVSEQALKLYYTVMAVGTVMGGLAAAVTVMFTDGFGAAGDVIKMMIADVDELGVKANKALDEFRSPVASKAPSGSDDSPVLDFKKDKGKSKKEEKDDPSRVSTWDDALAGARLYYEQSNDLRQMSKADEIKFWRDILANDSISATERVAVQRKVVDVELAMLKEQAATRKALAQEEIAGKEQASLSQVAAARQESKFMLDTNKVDKEQALELERGFEQREFEIKAEALAQRQALLQDDPEKNVIALTKTKEEMLQLEREHSLRVRQIQMQQEQASAVTFKGMFSSIGQGWASLIQQFAKGTMTIGSFFKQMATTVLNTVINMLAQIGVKWAAEKAMEIALGKTAAVAKISAFAGEAGAAGTASFAGAPWPINMGAPAFGAAMAAAAMGYMGVASASQGFDIPAGVNPLTQLHQREMVLPEEHANTIRDLGRGGGGGGGGGAPVELKGVSAGEFFIANRKDLIAVLKGARRDFAF